MVTGYCPDCGERHPITPTGEVLRRDGEEVAGQRYWELVDHDRPPTDQEWRDAGCPAVEYRVRCEGSKKKI